mmetsp:Transcript_53435/g.159896  ORF Transcript_53435/g.159896 Transcript_53435/m.159896 type:complete len:133 (-) Transcript_53435:116-514(-)
MGGWVTLLSGAVDDSVCSERRDIRDEGRDRRGMFWTLPLSSMYALMVVLDRAGLPRRRPSTPFGIDSDLSGRPIPPAAASATLTMAALRKAIIAEVRVIMAGQTRLCVGREMSDSAAVMVQQLQQNRSLRTC